MSTQLQQAVFVATRLIPHLRFTFVDETNVRLGKFWIGRDSANAGRWTVWHCSTDRAIAAPDGVAMDDTDDAFGAVCVAVMQHTGDVYTLRAHELRDKLNESTTVA